MPNSSCTMLRTCTHETYTDAPCGLTHSDVPLHPAAPENVVRQGIFVIMSHWFVETVILLCIITQTVTLALTIPGDRADHIDLTKYSPVLDNIFLGVYTVEMCARIFALGFVRSSNAYLRSAWNILDFSLVNFSWVYMALKLLFPDYNAVNPGVLRIVRCIRPLRTAGFVQGVQSAMNSWPYLVNLSWLLLFAMTMFGVLGVQLFGGALTFQCLGEISDEHFTGPDCTDESSAMCNGCVEAYHVPVDQCSSWGIDCSCYGQVPEPEPEQAAELAEALLQSQRAAWIELNRTAIQCPKQLECPTSRCAFAAGSAWGFDDISSALLTAWIAMTGDQWSAARRGMFGVLSESPSKFSSLAWGYFVAMSIVLNLVIGNLFAAVICHSFLEESNKSSDHKAIEDKIRKEKTLFNRIDADGSGEIEVEELRTIVKILDLQDTEFAPYELEEAQVEMDCNGDGSVDFEEFANWWDSNSAFVIKLKKAIRYGDHMFCCSCIAGPMSPSVIWI